MSSATKQGVTVDIYPTMVTQKYLFPCKTKVWTDVRLHVARGREILLCKNRLYMHEFLTDPPLNELRVLITEDEGPLHRRGDVAFKVSLSREALRSNYLTV